MLGEEYECHSYRQFVVPIHPSASDSSGLCRFRAGRLSLVLERVLCTPAQCGHRPLHGLVVSRALRVYTFFRHSSYPHPAEKTGLCSRGTSWFVRAPWRLRHLSIYLGARSWKTRLRKSLLDLSSLPPGLYHRITGILAFAAHLPDHEKMDKEVLTRRFRLDESVPSKAGRYGVLKKQRELVILAETPVR